MSYGPGPGQPPYDGGTGGYLPPPPGGTGGYPPPGGHPPPPGGPGGYPPPPPSGGYGPQEPPFSMGAAIGAIIANVFGLCLCWAFAIIGLVLGIIGAAMATSNPKAAKTCTIISWVLFGVGLVVGIIYMVLYGAWYLTMLNTPASGY